MQTFEKLYPLFQIHCDSLQNLLGDVYRLMPIKANVFRHGQQVFYAGIYAVSVYRGRVFAAYGIARRLSE